MLVALKIVSWNENPSRQRDAQDINYIISNYEKIDPDAYECLLDNHIDILEKFDHESSSAVVALMGLRIKNFTNEDHVQLIKNILSDSIRKEKLARSMIVLSRTSSEEEEKLIIQKLEALLMGLNYLNG
ncbi:MAG: hypothetical protein A2504_01985 [Bdellovibrionales bacterium RIFOXYD12_FULL_39_22]|nr:MAG: hypothetical protein A2385_12010 [Bdellovibrionales bacterium RIFOXYB1_FULL_39_21]OFZ41368.1 MAG: hypothetical protein A2485_01180 [Bdellovibrionales bacterium RIFOXYC12_FULL_39_17]OFZ45322.1 MAG: hypothetical protein A2404_13195 [Bdellovibrionales bacterium RIFOXYC1_FULL_39_130]OFZ74518.1 MAG: hypothetical protein A2560_12300 [Bdellovibrionales bacterium RIFOXYD1_FULL_39_84]OFZ92528.1 MAG: hypothetical protein A2504_01985 [Bdellovibrionales bacterium RIFOXYD12_FULL_39_22]